MLKLNVETFMGQLYFGVNHDNQMSCVMSQIYQGKKYVVAPPNAQDGNFTLIYPLPRWDERNFTTSLNGKRVLVLTTLW